MVRSAYYGREEALMTVMALEPARDGAAEDERLRALADLGVSGTDREERG